EVEKAGHDNLPAKSVVFYSRNNVKTLYKIVAGNQESKDKAVTCDLKECTLFILDVTEELIELGYKGRINRSDIIDIFCCAKTIHITSCRFDQLRTYQKDYERRPVLKLTKDEAKHLFDDLVVRGIIVTDIIIAHMTDFIYFIKQRKGVEIA
ncbi:16164_t:CDS:2, partial [Racocetra fulgida]